jgi:hypothetical protein
MPFEAEHALSRTKETPEMKKQKKLGIKVRDPETCERRQRRPPETSSSTGHTES